MESKNTTKIPSTLSQYVRLKAKEYMMSECQLSKLIIPGSSGSLIASIRYDQNKLSEEKITKIANFFEEDPNILIFMSGKIPKEIKKMIIKNKDVQFFLLDTLKVRRENINVK